MGSAQDFVDNANEIPVMPPVAAEVMRKAEDPDSDLPSLAQLIARDASLAIRVLKIANSSFYSMPRKIETIQQGIVLLGFSTLRSVVVAAAMKDVFSRFGLAERLLWEHAIACGVACSVVTENISGIPKDQAFVGGLVHDMGKLVMHSQAEPQYQEVMRVVYAGEKESVEAEQDVFGFDHTEVGELVLRKWQLPDRLSAAVGAHHNPNDIDEATEGKPLAAVFQFADLLCIREGLGRRTPNPDINPLDCEGAEILGIKDHDLDDLIARFSETYDKEREVFG